MLQMVIGEAPQPGGNSWPMCSLNLNCSKYWLTTDQIFLSDPYKNGEQPT